MPNVDPGGNGHPRFYRMCAGLYLPTITPPHFGKPLTPSPPPSIMLPKSKRNGATPLDTGRGAHRPTAEGGGPAIIKTEDTSAYIAKLKQLALGNQRLSIFIVDQLQGLSGTIPASHGREIVSIRFHTITLV